MLKRILVKPDISSGGETFYVQLFEGCGATKATTPLKFVLVRCDSRNFHRQHREFLTGSTTQGWTHNFTTCGHHYAAWQTLCDRCLAKNGLKW